ncbi:hypothetical protein niasHT_021473 [Heterodera trifolii]|uniref:Uncharacterized protein n=1 Tax=Heterodera trifolii TaxID=157864 RepID=A0ABD2KIV5_9BILA
MSDKFVGKWNLESSENFSEFMKKVCVSFHMLTPLSTEKPVLEFVVSNAGVHWVITTFSSTLICSFSLMKFEKCEANSRPR